MITDADPAPFSIGRFSRVTTLSVRMLRYYADHGVLVPAHTDPDTGYRTYSAAQLREAGRVRVLRDLGFGVAAMATLLPADPETFLRALETHRAQLADDARLATERLHTLDTLLTHYQENPMTLDIARTVHPAQTAVTLRRVIASYDAEHELWTEMMDALPPVALPLIDGPGMAIFHDADFRESDVDVEIALPLAAAVEVSEPLVCTELPERDVVVATLNGSYDQMAEATQAAAAWIEAHDLQMVGGMYNRYLVGPAQNPDPSAWVTEACMTVADRSVAAS